MFAIGRKTLAGAVLALSASLILTGAGRDDDAPKPGDRAPDFTLKDTTGKEHKLSEILAKDDTKAVVLEWFNADCPYVVRHFERDETSQKLIKEYKDKGVVWIGVNTGEAGKQGAGRERNQRAINDWKLDFPIVLDTNGDVGRSYGAKTTPHMFVIKSDGTLAYAGGIDNDPRGTMSEDERVNYVELALEAVLNGTSVETPTARAYGCSVKY